MKDRFSTGYWFILLMSLSLWMFFNFNCKNTSKPGKSVGASNSERIDRDVNKCESATGKGVKNSYFIKTMTTIGVEEARNEEEMPYQIASIRNIDCDAGGNLYLVESKTHCVKVFDQRGKFLRKLFRMGRGPNEIYSPAFGKINKFSNTLFQTIDFGYGMKEFTLDGKFIRTISLPAHILVSYDFLSKKRIIFIAQCIQSEKICFNFKVLNIDNQKISPGFAPYVYFDRPDTFNGIQRFVIKDDILWTSPIHDTHLVGYDLKNEKQVKKLAVKENVKKNREISFQKNGMTGYAIVGYNYAQPLLIDGELYAIWTEKDYNLKKSDLHHAINYPGSWKLSLYRLVNDEKLEKVADLKDCDYMRLETTWKNRIILSGKEPFFHIKIIEVKPKSK